MQKDELKDFLLKQGVWDREVNELLSQFNENVTEKDLKVVCIFDSAYDLGENYIDSVVGELDHHVSAVLGLTELGKQLAESCDEYFSLSDGRIVEFEL